ncbi:MAG: hypothetical protein JXJ19_02370 [Elusimicrobia bacterium]|nr:hypothetical protein [Elusimicrobiota bacterium]
MGSNSKFVFALIIFALIVGWIYMLFVPSHTIRNNLELNANYYPAITEESVRNR